jgi:hypothetical protein
MVVDGYFILAGLLATVIGLLAAACLARGDASRAAAGGAAAAGTT